jgi:hypothetical protein
LKILQVVFETHLIEASFFYSLPFEANLRKAWAARSAKATELAKHAPELTEMKAEVAEVRVVEKRGKQRKAELTR